MNPFRFFRSESPAAASQWLGVWSGGAFHHFELETLHLHETVTFTALPREHRHNVYHVALYTQGSEMLLNGRRVSMPVGSLVWTSPGEPHCFASDYAKPGCYHEVTFRLLDGGRELTLPLENLLELYSGTAPAMPERPFVLTEENYRIMNGAFEHLCGILRQYDYSSGRMRIFPAVLNLLASFGEIVTRESRDVPEGDGRLLQAAEFLKSSPEKSVPLEKAARRAGMSKEHFCRKFKQYFGVSPIRFRRNCRLATAAQVLRYSERPLKDVARELGFHDIQHFTHQFSAFHGISPHRFRLECRNDAEE